MIMALVGLSWLFIPARLSIRLINDEAQSDKVSHLVGMTIEFMSIPLLHRITRSEELVLFSSSASVPGVVHAGREEVFALEELLPVVRVLLESRLIRVACWVDQQLTNTSTTDGHRRMMRVKFLRAVTANNSMLLA